MPYGWRPEAALVLIAFLGFASAASAGPALEPGFPLRAYAAAGTYGAGPNVHITVGDVDGDPAPEIVASPVASGPLYAWNGDGTLVDGWPRAEAAGFVYAALGELTRASHGFEVVGGGWRDPIVAWDGSGAVLSGWPRIAGNYVQSSPVLTDVDGDGLDEVFINESFGTPHGYRADGRPLPGWPPTETRPTFGEEITPAVADLDRDGDPELVTVGGHSSGAYVFARHHDGTNVTGFPVRVGDRGGIRSSPAIGDVDADGAVEIVAPYMTDDSSGPDTAIAVLSADGRLERRLISDGNQQVPAAVLADLTGDDVPEILLQVDGRVEAWRGDTGGSVTGWPVVNEDEWSDQAPVVGDVDGDGKPDVAVVTRGLEAQEGFLRVYDRHGQLLPGFPYEPPFGGSDLTPAIADVDLDGRNEILVAGFEGPWAGHWAYVFAYDLGGTTPHGAIEWGQFGGGPRHEGRYGAAVSPPQPPQPVGGGGEAGPARRVADLRSGSAGSRPAHPAALAGELLFRADDGSHGPELYASDGTAAGTRLVHDIVSGASGSRPRDLVTAGDRTFFVATTPSHGAELWLTEGTAGTTRLVKDIWPGPAGSEPRDLVAVGDAVFFAAWDGSHGYELWRSDGTGAGTRMVADTLVGSGAEPSGAASSGDPTLLTLFGGGLGFTSGAVDEQQNTGRFPMRTSATGSEPVTFGFRLLSSSFSPYHDGDIAAAGGTLFLHDGSLLMRTDGTDENWTAFFDHELGWAGPFAMAGDTAFVAGRGPDGYGHELWRLGLTGTPQRVTDIAPGIESSNPQELVPYRGGVAMRARTAASGVEPWRTDGTSATALGDIRPGPASSGVARLTPVGDDLLFGADDGVRGNELWRSDGSLGGTHLLADIAPGVRSSAIAWIARAGDMVFLSADDGTTGQELWAVALPLPAPPPPAHRPPAEDPPPSEGSTSDPAASQQGSTDPAPLFGESTSSPGSGSPESTETTNPLTPAAPRSDVTAPRISNLRVRRRGRRFVARFRLSEPAAVKVILQRRVRGRWRTLRLSLTRRVRTSRGAVELPRRALRSGSYRLTLVATDGFGNRATSGRRRFEV